MHGFAVWLRIVGLASLLVSLRAFGTCAAPTLLALVTWRAAATTSPLTASQLTLLDAHACPVVDIVRYARHRRGPARSRTSRRDVDVRVLSRDRRPRDDLSQEEGTPRPQTLPSSHALLRAACCVHVRAPHTPRLPARMSTARTVVTCCQLSMPYNPAGHSEEHGDCGLRPARRRLRVRLPFSVCVCAGACARCQHCAATPMVRSQDNMKRFKFIPPKMVKGCQVSRRGGGGGCLLCCLPAPPGTHTHVAARSHLPVSSLPLAPYALPDSSASVT